MANPLTALTDFVARLVKEADTLATAEISSEREKLVAEHAELADQKLLSTRRAIITTRRDLFVQDALYATALAEVQTKGITQKANELVDTYLTTAVVKQFESECLGLEIGHLKVGLARKSGQTKASFQTDPGTKLTKAASDILSEGEQRALALATFMTEIAVTEGTGPIVIDDPVSSLDRQRGVKVAIRLVEEALKRQVIVFTHDLIFFNDLCREANDRARPRRARKPLPSKSTNAHDRPAEGAHRKRADPPERLPASARLLRRAPLLQDQEQFPYGSCRHSDRA